MKNIFLLLLLCFSYLTINACSSIVSAAHKGPLIENEGKRTWGTYIDDGVIESKASINLTNTDQELAQARIIANSFNGIVLLVGQISKPELKDRATHVVKQIRHVKIVENQLSLGQRISFSQRAADNWLGIKVKWAIARNTELSGSRIKVVVENNDVFLMGLLNREEANSVVEATSTVLGIKRIVKVFEYLN